MKFYMSLIAAAVFATALPAHADSCDNVVAALNDTLSNEMGDTINAAELVNVLRTLNNDNNTKLPSKFVTKARAQSLGWRPGASLWSVRALYGDSIGGDVFTNSEGSLPDGYWHEADLDYTGGHRNAKRIVYSTDGQRYVTVDHYTDFYPVDACD
ncbi:MAG: ribonuclease [Burkholderiales bacterium]|nr:ribonuclease [Burkholderiales bacterium]